ncbi:skin secretory protein xP2-like [Brachypodium distachyon]|uniref:skin secretory protein xP2-like n=1 Tax=Brachypodium distachyon TaxID=15368 RepID=UPI00052FFB87|nr:skin secretory protein xP2-like [Brachypodium distachyon]|eukprot:XP_010227201.1 skin secretory protein xP2-like [Brachypodium distachyon]
MDAGSGADPADTGARDAAFASAGDPAPMEVALATGDAPPAANLLETPAGMEEEEGETPPASPTALQGPSAPAPEAGATVVDLDSDVEFTGTAGEPKAVPTPSPAVPAAAAAATTAAPGTASGDAPAAADAAGADSSAAQQGRSLPGTRQPHQPRSPHARAETKKEHAEVLAVAQARIDEKSDLIANYLGEIQGLRVKLEVQIKATESAAGAAAPHEI